MLRYTLRYLAAVIASMGCVLIAAVAGPAAPKGPQAQTRPALSLLAAPATARPGQAIPVYNFTEGAGIYDEPAPVDLMVYTVTRATPTRDSVCDLATRFGVEVSKERYAVLPATAGGRSYSATLGPLPPPAPGDFDVLAFDDGNYHLTSRPLAPTPSDEAPGDEAARVAAEAFLARSGLLPPGCAFAGVRAGEAVSYTTPGVRDILTRVMSKIVDFYRYSDGVADGVFSVRVNRSAQVYDVKRNMRSVVPLRRYPILSKQEAVQALRAGQAVVAGPWVEGTPEAVVERVELEYYEDSTASDLDTLQPVYNFYGSVVGSPDRFLATLPAVRPEYLAPPVIAAPGGSTGKSH